MQANLFHHFYLKYFIIIFLICLLIATFQVNILFAFRPRVEKNQRGQRFRKEYCMSVYA